MPRYRLPTRKDWLLAAVVIAGFVAAIWGILRYGIPGSPAAAILAACAALLLLVRWHAATTAYRCAACGHEFEISMWRDLVSPHLVETKYLRCPACKNKTWALALKKADSPSGRGGA